MDIVLVVVPAHDEEERIGACVQSLCRAADVARRERGVEVRVTVVLDRCTDDTARVAIAGGAATVAVDAGCVGAARRAGIDHAVRRLGAHDPGRVLIVNTDADCVVPESWLVDHVDLAADHDLVLGEVEPDPDEMTVAALELWWESHPVGRGSLHGANLAVRLDAYRRAGGFPPVADREDAALVRALRAQGAAVVGGTRVRTSARRTGRVPAGFAGYLRSLDRALAAAPTVTP